MENESDFPRIICRFIFPNKESDFPDPGVNSIRKILQSIEK